MRPSQTLERETSRLFDYVPCAWYGCEDERHHLDGPAAGHCREHGLVKIQQNQRLGVETIMEREERSKVTAAAKKVLAASRELDASNAAVRNANDRKRAAVAEWRETVRELLAAGQDAI